MGTQKTIVVVGLGYVGSSLAVLLAGKHRVIAVDTNPDRTAAINAKRSPIHDDTIAHYLQHEKLDISATTDGASALKHADFAFIATPTDYDPETNYFNTSSVETVVDAALQSSTTSTVVIKSTIPVGLTDRLNSQHKTDRIIFSPEFLREGKALEDNLHPSRIIAGGEPGRAKEVVDILAASSLDSCPIFTMTSTEAEAVKLFANTYLAMRVAYFNELDTYAEMHGLHTKAIVSGVSSDPRIGDYYNNPSFGYGGYCLPKDTKQLAANFADIPHDLVEAIVSSNDQRIQHITQQIVSRNPQKVGVYRLIMKAGSDNFRSSAVSRVIEKLLQAGIQVVAYEPSIADDRHESIDIMHDLAAFKASVDIIIANRLEDELRDTADKVYTRDIFSRD